MLFRGGITGQDAIHAPPDRLQRLYQIRALRALDTTKKFGFTPLYMMPGERFFFARIVAGESFSGFATDCTVKFARRASMRVGVSAI